MKLSIGMIVKNEEKYLEKCLTALKPILENVDSELIIADTGSTDSTVEIAKKFTDNVFHFEWINDFAAARNSTLERAQGEWYMFIDADEIITDPSDLINFFNSGEYKQYLAASIAIKSYNDLSRLDLFNSYNLHRLARKDSTLHFDGAIHETLVPIGQPVKNLKVIADHYGYVIKENGKTLDTLEKKSSRNLEMLFRELEEGKKNGNLSPLVYSQISDCYLMLDNCEEALKYLDLGMDYCDPRNIIYINYYNKKLKALNRLGRHEEVIELCKKYFSKDNLTRRGKLVTDNSVYFYWAASSYALNDYDETINKAVLGFEIYREYRSGKLYTPELNYSGFETTIPMLKQLCGYFIISCRKQNRFADAAAVLPNMPLEEFMSDADFMDNYLQARISAMENTNYNKLPDLYYRLDAPNRQKYIDILIRNIFITKQTEHFIKKLSLIAKENERLDDMVKLFNSFFIRHDLMLDQVTAFIKKHGTKNNEIVWILMMKSNFSIMPFIEAEDFDPHNDMENVYLDIFYADQGMGIFEDQVPKLPVNELEKVAEVYECAVSSAVQFNFDTTSIIRAYVLLGRRWREANPEKEAPENIAFALDLADASDAYRKKQYKESIALLEKLIEKEKSKCVSATESEPTAEGESAAEGETPDKGESAVKTDNADENKKIKILTHYSETIKTNEIKNAKLLESQNSNPELIVIAKQIKAEIRNMIEQWDLNGAEDALNKMAQMTPFDPDIESLRDEITDRKTNYMKYM